MKLRTLQKFPSAYVLSLEFALAFSVPPTGAEPLVQSGFDADTEGWTTTGDATAPAWQAAGGDPGGHISATDKGQGIAWYFRAPAAYTGNRSDFYGKYLFFSMRQSDATPSAGPDVVVLRGAGVTLLHTLSQAPGTTWTRFRVRLDEIGGWHKSSSSGPSPTDAEFRAVLAGLTNLDIRGEYSSSIDTGRLDSVSVETFTVPPTPLPAESRFDADGEGWGLYGDGGNLTWHASGGNPGGYLSAVDQTAGTTWGWKAPAKFLGDVGAACGGSLSFDLVQNRSDAPYNDADVILTAGTGTLVYDTPANPQTTWTHYAVPLQPNARWHRGSLTGATPSEADFRSALSNLMALQIRGEYRAGADTGGLDNVVLSTTPVVTYGDADEDGTVTVNDALRIAQLCGGLGASAHFGNADVAPAPATDPDGAGDGRLDLLDAVKVLRFVGGLDKTLP